MEIDDVEVIELELKYCERCGGLWFRVVGDGEVFCAPCALRMVAEAPGLRQYVRRQRMAANHKVDVRGSRVELRAVCSDGGNS